MDKVKNKSITAPGYAVLSLAAGGLVLVAYFLAIHWTFGTDRPGNIALPGSAFRAVIGSAGVNDGHLYVSEFKSDGRRNSAVITARRAFDAGNYRFISLGFGTVKADLEATLFWKPADVDGFFRLPITMPSDGDAILDMSLHQDWVGKITEIGLILTQGSQPAPVDFVGLTLEPEGPGPAARQLLTEWTSFRGFTQSSINSLSASLTAGVLSPVPVGGAWVALSFLLLALGGLTGLVIPRLSYLLVVLVPWVLLDLLWQHEISSQLALTKNLFADKSMAERHESDIDSAQFDYAMTLKTQVLPSEPVRLFILHDSYDQNLDRLKMQYYLLPHNIYNFGLLPPEKSLRKGDYLLTLGPIPGLEYDRKESVLKWGDIGRLAVTQKHVGTEGSLYVVVGAADDSSHDIPERGVPE